MSNEKTEKTVRMRIVVHVNELGEILSKIFFGLETYPTDRKDQMKKAITRAIEETVKYHERAIVEERAKECRRITDIALKSMCETCPDDPTCTVQCDRNVEFEKKLSDGYCNEFPDMPTESEQIVKARRDMAEKAIEIIIKYYGGVCGRSAVFDKIRAAGKKLTRI